MGEARRESGIRVCSSLEIHADGTDTCQTANSPDQVVLPFVMAHDFDQPGVKDAVEGANNVVSLDGWSGMVWSFTPLVHFPYGVEKCLYMCQAHH